MAKHSGGLNREVLSAALEGLEAQKRRIEEQLLQVRSMLGLTSGRRGRPPKSASSAEPTPSETPRRGRKRRKLSAEARARISAAQKKRWAATKR
jgi:outer membrane protein TolC